MKMIIFAPRFSKIKDGYITMKVKYFLAISDKSHLKMTLAEEVTFFNKGAILNELDKIPKNSHLEIDVRKTQYFFLSFLFMMIIFVIQITTIYLILIEFNIH